MKFTISVILMLCAGLSFGQTCKLQWNTQKSCLDIASLSDDRIVLPANTTRLSQDGLSLCPISSEHSKIPAILFIMDQSASMDSAFGGVPAGDPEHWRGNLVRNAIRYLAERSAHTGWFSYLEFAGDTAMDLQPPHNDCIEGVNDGADRFISQGFLALSDSIVDVWGNEVASPVRNRCNTGTNYFAALDRAKRILASFAPGDVAADPAVIFVSDGRPNKQTSNTFAPLSATYEVPGSFPPVHGIFLGGTGTTDGDDLSEISTRTGGTYNLISPHDTVAMGNVMNGIIDLVSKISLPDSVVLSVNGTRYPSSKVALGNGSYHISFPQDIPLKSGDNQFVMTVVYQDSATGNLRNHETRFVLAVESPAADTGTIVIDSSFSATCYIGNSLTVGNFTDPKLPAIADLAKTPWLDSAQVNGTALGLSAQGYTGTTTIVRIKSRTTGDTASITLTGSNHIFGGTIKDLSTAKLDTLDILWVNPEDARDSIQGQVMVYRIPVARFLTDTLFINQIASSVSDVAAKANHVEVDYSWFEGAYVDAHSLGLGSNGSYSGTKDMREQLQAKSSPRLVLTYRDPLFGLDYRDTAMLLFQAPVLPVAWLLDNNGDGKADLLELRFAQAIPTEQHMARFQLVWGITNQDTVRLQVDSLNPAFSDNVVQISTTNGIVKWSFPISSLPFGHTTGSTNTGAGSLAIAGAMDIHSFQQTIPVEDKVGPVLLDAWLDSKTLGKFYFLSSEPVASAQDFDWFLGKRPDQHETRKTLQDIQYDSVAKVHIGQLSTSSRSNLLLGGDSARYVPLSQGTMTDRNGNGASENNPFVLVRGNNPGFSQIEISVLEDLVGKDPGISLDLPTATFDKEKFRTIVLDPAKGQYSLTENGQVLDPRFMGAMPSFGIELELPQTNGYNAQGEALDPLGSLKSWTNILNARALFFDGQGQYIGQKEAEVVLDDTSYVDKKGMVKLVLAWEPEPGKGLAAETGRAVGTGPIFVKMFLALVSTAKEDILVYDRSGSADPHNSILKGETRGDRESSIVKFGYIHK